MLFETFTTGCTCTLHTLSLLAILTLIISMSDFLFPLPIPFHSHPSSYLLLRAEYGFCSNLDKVDATMNSINEQRDIANEISEAISNTANVGLDLDEVR